MLTEHCMLTGSLYFIIRANNPQSEVGSESDKLFDVSGV